MTTEIPILKSVSLYKHSQECAYFFPVKLLGSMQEGSLLNEKVQ